jgi:hypothetical protein
MADSLPVAVVATRRALALLVESLAPSAGARGEVLELGQAGAVAGGVP